MGSPCLTPFPKLKYLVVYPLLIMHAHELVYTSSIYFMKELPKLKNRKALLKNFQLNKSKAFFISIAYKILVNCFCLVYSIISATVRVYSPISLPLRKPNRCSPIIDGKFVTNLLESALVNIL